MTFRIPYQRSRRNDDSSDEDDSHSDGIDDNTVDIDSVYEEEEDDDDDDDASVDESVGIDESASDVIQRRPASHRYDLRDRGPPRSSRSFQEDRHSSGSRRGLPGRSSSRRSDGSGGGAVVLPLAPRRFRVVGVNEI
jgi:hypothetical protein